MRYIRLKCPKCGYTQEVTLDDYNSHIRLVGRCLWTCPVDYWDEIDTPRMYGNHIFLEIDEIFDHNPIESKIESKVEKRNSL